MPAKRGRDLTVLDALALIAAIAVGLGWTRHVQSFNGYYSYPEDEGISHHLFRFEVFAWWVRSLVHCGAVVTFALLLLRLRRPRPRLRSLARQPGAVACGAVLLGLSAEYLEFLVLWAKELPHPEVRDGLWQLFYYFSIWGDRESIAVATTWLLLAVGGRWRREPGWIDGMGIVLGVIWLGHPYFQHLAVLIHEFLK